MADSKWTDPREVVKCACPRLDGGDCMRWRSGLDWDEYEREGCSPCECHCHDMYECVDSDDGESS